MSKGEKKYIDPQNFVILDAKHKAFEHNEVKSESDEDKGKATLLFYEGLVLEKWGLTNASHAVKKAATVKVHNMMRDFNSDDPSIWGAQKILNKLGEGHHADAVKIAELKIKHDDAIRQYIKDELGAAGRNTRSVNANNRKHLIIECYMKNKHHFTKKNQAYHHFAKLYNIGWTTVRGYLIGI